MNATAILSAAFIAGGTINSMAQSNLYSSNIVGYATVSLPTGNSLLANPLSTGVTNGANEIGLQIPSEQILTWNGRGFNYVSYDPTFGGWVDENFAPSVPPSLPPGTGFFFFNPGAATNFTFVGQVVPGPSSTNLINPPIGYSLLGSPLPVNVNNISSPPVSLPLVPSMQVLTWGGTGYVYSSWDLTFGGWIDENFAPKSAPPYAIGQGFFLFSPSGEFFWRQSLP